MWNTKYKKYEFASLLLKLSKYLGLWSTLFPRNFTDVKNKNQQKCGI